MAVNLNGLSFGRAVTVSDVLTPKVRRAPFNEDVNPNHLDATECWKDLSHTQARELTMWYQFLHKCLHNEVREVLSKEVVKDLLESKEAIEEAYLVARMLECLRSKPQRIIDVNFADVIDSMMGMFHDQFPNESASLASSWSHFSGGLSLFLHNFLRLQDCFQHSALGPCLEVKFDFQYADWLLTANGDIVWHSSNIRFLHVPATRVTGELYRITPFVGKEVDRPVRLPYCDGYVDQVDYTIPRSSLSFSWDPAKRCFKTVVPHFSYVNPHTVETVVQATVATPFPDHVKFERQSRWSIKLDIMPGKSDHQPLTQRQGIKRFDLLTTKVMRNLENRRLWRSRHATVLRHIPRNAIDPQSPQKRKVSRPEVVDAVAALKRRRRDSISGMNDEVLSDDESTSDNWYEKRFLEEVQQMAERNANDARIDPACSQTTQHGADQGHITPPGQSVPMWTGHLDQCDSGLSSFSAPPAISEESALSNDATGHETLHQEEILDNYHEFADRKLFKDAGLISPVSDSERRAYESIFMGDCDGWSPVTDGSAMNLDTVLSER